MIDVSTALQAFWDWQNKAQVEDHLHVEDVEGASSLGDCNALRGWKEAGLPIPPQIGIKAKYGPMMVGTFWHDLIQQNCIYLHETKWKKEEPDTCFSIEVYTEQELLPDEFVVSPIDLAFAHFPGFTITELQLRNKTKTVPVIHPDATWDHIYDIKTASDYAYWKQFSAPALKPKYEAQGLVYLKATGLPSMQFLFVNKDNGDRFYKELKYSDERWAWLKDKRQREHVLADALRPCGNYQDGVNFDAVMAVPFVDADFRYMTEDDTFECTYCPLSKCHEEIMSSGKTSLVFDEPCPACVRRVIESAQGKFTVGGKFTRGSSFITINSIEHGIIMSTNKSGTEFRDSIFSAVKSFDEGWVKKERKEKK